MRAKEHLVADLKDWAAVDPEQFLLAIAELIDHVNTLTVLQVPRATVDKWLTAIGPTLASIEEKNS